MKTADELREEANKIDRRVAESFERCDTDGFVSQWAGGLTADLRRLEALLVESDGLWEFEVLTDLDGNIIPAKKIDGRFGECWAILDSWDWSASFTGQFVSVAVRQSTYVRKGFRTAIANAPAKAKIIGPKGRGLAGAANCRAVILQTGLPVGLVEEEG